MKKFLLAFVLILALHVLGSLAGRKGCLLPLSTSYPEALTLSASSSAADQEPWRAQKQAPKAWCARGTVKFKEYLQMKLDKARHISAVEILGIKYSYREFFVKSFLIGYSLDGKKWKFYKSSSKKTTMFWTQKFDGNTDSVSSKWNYLHSSFIAKYIRLYPLTFRNGMCLKVELYGCNDALDCTHTVKLNQNETTNIVSPSYPHAYPPNTICNWLISLPESAPRGSVIAMDFDVDGGPNCTMENVKVYNHVYSFSKHLQGTYCSSVHNMMPRVTNLENNEFLRIMFNGGNNTDLHRGFSFVVRASDEGLKTASACEGANISLDCGHKRNIEIIDAFYGRYQLPNTTCVAPATNGSSVHGDLGLTGKSCRTANNVVAKLQESCDNRNVCQVAVKESVFPSKQGCASSTGPLEMFVAYQCNATQHISQLSTPTKSIAGSSSFNTQQHTNAIATTTAPPPTTVAPDQPTQPETTPAKEAETTQAPDEPTDLHHTKKILTVQDNRLTSSLMFIVAVSVAAAVLVIIIVITVCCICCRRARKKDKEITKMGVVPSESFQSKCVVESDSLYEKIDDIEREMNHLGRYETEPNRYSPLHNTHKGMSENPLYQSGDADTNNISRSYDALPTVRYIGASETPKYPHSLPEPSNYIDVLKSPEELPANSIPITKYLEPSNSSPPDHTTIIINEARYSSSPCQPCVLASEEVYESMTGSVA